MAANTATHKWSKYREKVMADYLAIMVTLVPNPLPKKLRKHFGRGSRKTLRAGVYPGLFCCEIMFPAHDRTDTFIFVISQQLWLHAKTYPKQIQSIFWHRREQDW